MDCYNTQGSSTHLRIVALKRESSCITPEAATPLVLSPRGERGDGDGGVTRPFATDDSCAVSNVSLSRDSSGTTPRCESPCHELSPLLDATGVGDADQHEDTPDDSSAVTPRLTVSNPKSETDRACLQREAQSCVSTHAPYDTARLMSIKSSAFQQRLIPDELPWTYSLRKQYRVAHSRSQLVGSCQPPASPSSAALASPASAPLSSPARQDLLLLVEGCLLDLKFNSHGGSKSLESVVNVVRKKAPGLLREADVEKGLHRFLASHPDVFEVFESQEPRHWRVRSIVGTAYFAWQEADRRDHERRTRRRGHLLDQLCDYLMALGLRGTPLNAFVEDFKLRDPTAELPERGDLKKLIDRDRRFATWKRDEACWVRLR